MKQRLSIICRPEKESPSSNPLVLLVASQTPWTHCWWQWTSWRGSLRAFSLLLINCSMSACHWRFSWRSRGKERRPAALCRTQHLPLSTTHDASIEIPAILGCHFPVCEVPTSIIHPLPPSSHHRLLPLRVNGSKLTNIVLTVEFCISPVFFDPKSTFLPRIIQKVWKKWRILIAYLV